jgi:hypothetical protein
MLSLNTAHIKHRQYTLAGDSVLSDIMSHPKLRRHPLHLYCLRDAKKKI